MAINPCLPASTWPTRWSSSPKCCCVSISTHHVHLNSYCYFLNTVTFSSFSSVEGGTGGTSRNGEVAKVRRGTDGPLPQPRLQAVVQRPHPADRRRFLHSHRPPRSLSLSRDIIFLIMSIEYQSFLFQRLARHCCSASRASCRSSTTI